MPWGQRNCVLRIRTTPNFNVACSSTANNDSQKYIRIARWIFIVAPIRFRMNMGWNRFGFLSTHTTEYPAQARTCVRWDLNNAIFHMCHVLWCRPAIVQIRFNDIFFRSSNPFQWTAVSIAPMHASTLDPILCYIAFLTTQHSPCACVMRWNTCFTRPATKRFEFEWKDSKKCVRENAAATVVAVVEHYL